MLINSIYSSKTVIKQLKKLVNGIDKQLNEIEKQIHKHLYSSDEVGQKIDHIAAIKGFL
ncbi:hypothetical protein [Mucilaginibacter xinganensis]|uniref:Transposase IS116/IS110/IS902 family protein n=1 Tax=Mucilaginibacter xinganensis TaxID=1234841 RepID=A0A223NRI2_9SPHI|nr:hypothetical protein [Mucilaginibacter xinganensis]ASU32519.1 Transposase IS116/IS110/IS902 family protein [Mucilaginibacter xinganensis]